MSVFQVQDPVVGSGPSNPSALRVQVWANNTNYSDGQMVIFNGSLYIANGVPPIGLIPPVEQATPQIAGQPKWLLAARGRSIPETWDDSKTYYQDQLVCYLGGMFILDAPTIASGTRPNRDKKWTRLSETLTETEGEKVSTSDLSSIQAAVTVTIWTNGNDETARVRHHWIRISSAVGINNGGLYNLTFPRAIKSQARPAIQCMPVDLGALGLFPYFTPLFSGTECTGYSCNLGNNAGAGTYEFLVTVKEQIDQVKVPSQP